MSSVRVKTFVHTVKSDTEVQHNKSGSVAI